MDIVEIAKAFREIADNMFDNADRVAGTSAYDRLYIPALTMVGMADALQLVAERTALEDSSNGDTP